MTKCTFRYARKISNCVTKLPFGEDIPANVGGRSNVQGYGAADNVKQKFGGKERDNESGLDYVQARYFSSQHGRFTSTDPVTATKKHIVNPQRWNLYVFVLNCPTSLTDPDGRSDKGKGGGKVIDVFIALPKDGPGGVPSADRKQIEARIRELAPDSKAKINVYDFEGSTPDNIAQSLRSKDRTTIVLAHIDGGYSEEIGGKNADGTARRGGRRAAITGGFIAEDGVQKYAEDGTLFTVKENIKAETFILLSCRMSPNTASAISSRMGANGTFIYDDGGDDGNSSAFVGVNMAVLAAAEIANGGTAQSAAEVLQRENDKAVNSGINEERGDRIITCDGKGRCSP